MSDSMPVLAGSLVLGRYRVVKELARGGMGMVYLGRIEGAAGFAKPVVIKRVLSHIDESGSSKSQFIREARLLSELQHPNIVGVIDFGQEGDSYLMVLEYVHGYHLGHWLKYVRKERGQLEWEFAVFVVIRILSALHYAHTHVAGDGKKRPIIHRDVSPGNVLIDLQGNVRLLDFGIARVSDEGEEFKTQEGIVKGKLPYIAPEMYQSAEASVASDVYAAGVMLYQLLSGRNPFSGKDMSTIVTRVLQHTPPPISSLRDDVPAELDGVLARAMAKDPSRRFSSAQAFAYALGGLLESPEPEVVEYMRTAVVADFTGSLPTVLGLPSLAVLDQAWRASSQNPGQERSLQRSSMPPDEDATAIVDVPQARQPVDESLQELSAGTALTPSSISTAGVPVAPATSTRTILLGMLGAAVLAAGATAGVLFLGQPDAPPPSGQRYLVVERNAGAVPERAPPAAREVSLEAGSDAAAPPTKPKPVSEEALEPTKAPAPPHAEGSGQSESQQLTLAFAKKQSSVQACFAEAAGELEGAPQVSVHFRLDGEGKVQSATLSPNGLSGTSLEQCLLGVARGTTFPALGKPVAFAIPITARVKAP